MNLHDIIIDRSPREKEIRINKLREELRDLGYSVVLTTSLTKLISEEKHQAGMEYAR